MALIPIVSKFSLHQQIRVLLRRLRNGKSQDAALLNEKLWITSTLSLEAPHGEVAQLEQETPDSPAHLTAWHNGLSGAMGALPVVYTEWMTERLYRYSDRSAKAFIDMFGHRLYCLDYLAWQKHHLYALAESRSQTPLQTSVLALTGQLTTSAYTGRMPPAPLFSSSVRSMVNLECWLRQRFGVPAKIIPFTGGWRDVPEHECCRPGDGQRPLGAAPMIGRTRLEIDSHFDVVLGPITPAQCQRFLPEGLAWQDLQRCIRAYVGPVMNFSLTLSVRSAGHHSRPADRRALGRGLCLGAEPDPASYQIRLPDQGV